MVLVMLVPFAMNVFPLIASAEEVINEENTPTVSLAWDTNTVTVMDGVATPYKNASATASSYTMSYTVTASGTITTPVTVRVQSFDISAEVSQGEYAKADTTVTLTSQNPTATGTATVYTQTGYSTKVTETGRIYTRELGLRITEIKNAKKQSGADTLRAQVLPRNGYTLEVSKNSQGQNYGGGTGTMPNAYVYTDMAKQYASGTISYKVGHQETVTGVIDPYSVLKAQNSRSLNALLDDFHYGVDVYFNGMCYVTSEQNVSGKRAGLTFKIWEYYDKQTGAQVAYNDRGDDNYRDGINFNWDVAHELIVEQENATAAAYHRGTPYDGDYIRTRYWDRSLYKYSFYNKEDEAWNKSVKPVKMNYSVMLVNSTNVSTYKYHVDNRAYGAGDTVYLTIYFDRPMQFQHNSEKPLKIRARIGSTEANYFTYCGGNMTDRLIFSMVLPENGEVYGNNIELLEFDNEDYNNTLADLFWNAANKNNMWTLEDSKIKNTKLICTVDTRTPNITVHDISGDSGIVKSGSFRATVSSITNQGKIDIAWTKEATPPTAQDAWSSVTFSADGDDKTTVSIEKKGLTGEYYAHIRATSVSGNQSLKTVGPFSFDNQSPTISGIRLTDGDNAQKYLKEHTLLFNISDVSIGVDKVYMKARHTDGDKGLKDGADELLVYDIASSDNLLSITDGAAQITVTSSMLDLAKDAYDAYIVGFYAVDKLGNQSDVYELSDALMFDNRNTFAASLNTKSDISIKGKQIYYNGKTLTFSHSESGSNTWVMESLKYNGVDITDKLAANGISGSADNGNKTYSLTLNENVQGYIEIVFKLNGERGSNVINFYVTSKEVNSPNYQKLYAPNRLLINEVWQLSTATFYSGNNRNGSYYVGTNLKPIFSGKDKALDYAKFFEKQDIVIEYIDDEVEKNNLEGGWLSNYRKAESDKDKAVAVGQTWLRYKSNAWTLGSNNEEHWVYYFYSNEKVTAIDPALTPALNAAIDRNAKLICNYNGDNRIYLTANNTSKGYVNSYSEPYYDARGILTEALSYQEIYSYDITISADNSIYESFITYDEQQIPLVANYKFSIDSLQHGFVYYRQHGTEEWLPLANGESFKDKLKASGLYEICEFGNGYMTYLVYVDLDAPVISYDLTVDGATKAGYTTSDTSGGTLRASKFTVKELLDSVSGGLPVERDRWAYFYILYSSLGGGEHAFMTMTDLNREGYKLSTGIYKIYACDRLGNMVMQTIKINTEDLKVTGSVSASGLTVTSNRAPADIMPGTFKVWRDNMLLSDETYSQSMTFSQSGVYQIEFEDVYGNFVNETFTFRRDLPVVTFSREKKEGTSLYEAITVNSEDKNNLSSVISEDNQLFTVSTSANIRISYPISSGYDFEFIGGEPEYKLAILSATNIDIKSTSKNWTLKIFYKNDPDVYILVTCIVDKDAPVISGSVLAKEYTYNDQTGAIDNVLFTPTGNTASSIFYSGESAVGDSAVISWTDETKVASISYSFNGGEKITVNPSVGSLTLPENGNYVFEAEDLFGNKSTFEFTLTDHIDFNLIIGGKEQTVDYESEKYIDGNRYMKTLYTGKETQLILKENALLALYYTDGGKSFLYNLEYEVNDGEATLLVYAFDAATGESIVIENGEIDLASSGKIFDRDIVINYTYENGVLTLILPKCEKTYEMWQLRISDFTGHSPVVVQIERSDKVSEMEIFRTDGTKLDLSYDGFVGSNQKLTLQSSSISEDTVEIVAYYSATYTESFANAEKIVLYGQGAISSLEKEGYYKIVATNKYGNERVIYVALSFKLSLDVHIEYDKIDKRIQTLNIPDTYSIFSNKSVNIVIWDTKATVVCLKNGVAFDGEIREEKGYLGFSLTKVGKYTVTVSDECGNVYILSVSIKEPKTLTYDGFLTGFNENALKKDQNYTNGALSLDKAKLEANGIKYVAFRKVGANEFVVLYDLINIIPTEYSEATFNGSIGKEDGEYEVWFSDAYGNLHVETVRISRKPLLSINCQTQDATKPSAYDFDFALQNGAWSNYELTFINTSEKYLLKIDGAIASFTDGKYIFTLPTSLGAAEQSYVLCYVDDYGNSYEIKINLYRCVPESFVAENADTVTQGGTLFVKSNFSMTWGDRITATYSLNGDSAIPFDQSTVFTEDGEYTLVFTDYAGNTSTRIMVKDSMVLYDMASDGFVLYNGAVVSSKVSLSPDEELTFTATRNGEEYVTETRSFTEDGHYVVTLTDRIGNVSCFEFTIYSKAKQSFTFTVPDGYSFSQIWYITDGHRVSLVSDVTLNESGAQSYTFSTDGVYEVELLHTASNQICYFTLNIDNIPPEALLVGAENGGVTRNNVTLEGLKNGDIIYVYKNGELVSTYMVDGDSETVLELLGNGDFGSYSVVIQDEAGNSVTYEFEKEFATNTFSNVFICLLLVSFGAIGIIYIRFNGKVRTK